MITFLAYTATEQTTPHFQTTAKQVLIKVYNSKMCKVAMNGRIHTTLHTLNKLFHTKKPSEMWMLIKKPRPGDGSCNKDIIISMDALCNHFSVKFTMISNGNNNDTTRAAEKKKS